MRKIKLNQEVFFYFLMFGLLLEAGTGLLVGVFSFWEITLFSLILIHLLVGFLLLGPFILFGIFHGWKESFFPGSLVSGRTQKEEGISGSRVKNQNPSMKRSKSSPFLWGIILFLFLLVSFSLGGYFTIAGVPRRNEWLLHVHIAAGWIGLILLLWHLKSISWKRFAKGFALTVPLIFFFNFFGKHKPVQQRIGSKWN